MATNNIVDFSSRDGNTDALTDLLRTGAQHLIATAVEAELESFLAQFATERTEAGHAAVVRNGQQRPRGALIRVVQVPSSTARARPLKTGVKL